MEIKQNILDAVNEWFTNIWHRYSRGDKDIMTTSPKTWKSGFIKSRIWNRECAVWVWENRINKYTLGKVRKAYLSSWNNPNQPLKAAIAYDCRHNSDTLAKVVADVFSANGIEVFLFSEMRPTPSCLCCETFRLSMRYCTYGFAQSARV
jgi:hypothetical protein